MTLLEMLGKVVLAALVGGLVGVERERRERPAGLRTHVLVCVGSTLFTLVSIEMAGDRADPTRIAAQIVTGIGFLGAGTIFRYGSTVRGLTTAAGLWVIAAVGMAVAVGGEIAVVALASAVIVYSVNKWVSRFEDRYLRVYRELSLRTQPGYDALAAVLEGLADRGIHVDRVEWTTGEGNDGVRFRVRMPPGVNDVEVAGWLVRLPGVVAVDWD